MDEKQCINPNNPVYISYAWANDDFPDLEDGVNALCKLLEENNIFYKRDKTNLCPYRWSITKAENEIGEGSAVIVVVSERYVKSLHCMHEWHLIRENGKVSKRVFPIVLKDAKLTDKKVFMQYYEYFVNRKDELVEQQRKRIIPLTEVESRASKFDFFVNDLQALYQYLAEHNHYFSEDNYGIIIEQLKDHLNKRNIDIIPEVPIIAKFANIPNIPNTAKTSDIVPSIPHFSLPVAEGLMPRDNEVENLFSLVSKNRIVNLVGVGGSGKSSLTYLLLDKHKDDFNEIAYVVVNNSVKDDVVEQINNTLRLEFGAGEDSFSEIFSYLQKNYRSEKSNLLILDINETSDKNANNERIEEFIQKKTMLNGWKILILSRESMDKRNRIESYSLNDQEDVDFLKELFLDKAGVRYRDFGSFKELFKVVCFNPLLTEQLGFYVKKYPKVLTINEMKTMLYGDSFMEQDMHGMSAQRHDETIVTFLNNLTKYSELSYNEKELLRHFVLWQSDYISFDVIEDLLRGVFESDDQLVNALASLSDRSILTVNSGQILSYKLHGLLADSLREQIDLSDEDYYKYLSNIERIIEYDYYKFLPYVDCIVNSLCEYDITTDLFFMGPSFINDVGIKLSNSWKYDYCQKVLEKNIKHIEGRLQTDNDNRFLLDQLMIAYTIISGTYFTNAQSAIEKLIELLERMPKDEEKYQDSLALAYILRASEQTDYEKVVDIFNKVFVIRQKLPQSNSNQRKLAHTYSAFADIEERFFKYNSAEKNYKKAIEILEQLPDKNPEYQNDLAKTYMNLANLQQDYLGEYELAETIYIKVIEIREKLPDNPNYQNDLAISYRNLGNLQSDHLGDYESAEKNYKKAITILEILPKENPEYHDWLAETYLNLGNLQRNHLGDYESAEKNYKKAITILELLPDENPEYQNDLARAYNSLANLQQDYLVDYEASLANYQKAIAILEQLPKESSEYQNALASVYNNLANLQRDHLGEYEASLANYQRTIAIREQLPKANPDYQNALARVYNSLANLQQDYLVDYEASLANYQKAIAILEQLSKESSEYQNALATVYNNLANMQQDHLGDYESSLANYQRTIAIREQLPKENPEYQSDLAGTYWNFANLQRNHLGDYKSSESNYQTAIAIREKLPKENLEYQKGLASAYNGLAYCYDAQKKYKEAISMIEKAIAIADGLLKKDSKYLIDWINYKHSFAEIVFNNDEVDRAKEILDEIKPLAEKCLAENPNDSWTQTVHKYIFELLEKCSNRK